MSLSPSPRSVELRAGTALAPVKVSVFLPYIFSHDEVLRILTAAGSHVGRFIGASMLRTLILVLYCTGLRLGEAVRLRTSDVDLEHGTFMIQRSKGRSRIVAIRPTWSLSFAATPPSGNGCYANVARRIRCILPSVGRLAPDHSIRIERNPPVIAPARHQACRRTRRRAPVRVPPCLCRASTHGLGE